MSEWRHAEVSERDGDFTTGQNDFINNTINRKVTVIHNDNQLENRNLNTFSEDSLDEEEDTIRSRDLAEGDEDSEGEGEGDCSLTDVTGEEDTSSGEVRAALLFMIASNISQRERERD